MATLRVAREIGTGVVVRGWTQVTSLLVILVAGRLLDVHEFGVFAIASVFMVAVTTILYSGIYEFIIKTEDFEQVADSCFWTNFALASGGGLAIAALAPLVAPLAHAPEVRSVMLWLAPASLIASLTSWQEAMTLRRKAITSYYGIWCFAETASAAAAVGMLFAGAGVFALVGYRYCGLLLTGICYLAHLRTWPRLAWRRAEARRALAFASGLYGSRIVAMFSNFGADLIIGILANPAAAGAYRLSSRMVFGVSEIWFQPIKTIAWVRFTSAQRGRMGLHQEWPALMMLLSMLAWPTLGAVAVLSRQLTLTVLGSVWLPAAQVVSILALGKATELFELFLDPLLGTSGETRLLFRIRSGGSVIAILGLLALAPAGAASAAWAQVATYWLLSGLTLVIGMRRTGVGARTLLATLLPGLFTTACVLLTAIVAEQVTSRTAWGHIPQFACDVAAVAAVWLVLIGVVFRRRTMAVITSLKDQAPRSEVSTEILPPAAVTLFGPPPPVTVSTVDDLWAAGLLPPPIPLRSDASPFDIRLPIL